MNVSTMGAHVDYYISAVRMKGEHITHLRVHKALSETQFAPHGVVQPRSTVIVNLRNRRIYRTLILEGQQAKPGNPVTLAEVDQKFYLRTDPTPDPGDDLEGVAKF